MQQTAKYKFCIKSALLRAKKGLFAMPNQIRGKNVLISGYYGYRNTGDDAILAATQDNLKKLDPDIAITVLSYRPEETAANCSVEALYRFNFRAINRAIKDCDIFVSGGGSLLQDRTSTRSLLYYLALIRLASLRGKKVMLYANGIGPIQNRFNRWLTRSVLRHVDLITLREEPSRQALLEMGVRHPAMYVTADPAFTFAGRDEEAARHLLMAEHIPLDRPLIAVSVRNWPGVEDFIGKFAPLLDRVQREFAVTIVLVPMQAPHDLQVSHQLRQRMQTKTHILRKEYLPEELMGVIGCMHFVLSMRLHTLIFAAKQRVPMIGYVYDPKIAAYLEQLEMPSAGDICAFDPERGFTQIKNMLLYYDRYVNILGRTAAAMEQRAAMNEALLINLLREGQTNLPAIENVLTQ